MIKIIVCAALILLFVAVGVLIYSVLTMEAADETEEDIKEICAACMWYDAEDKKACENCFIRRQIKIDKLKNIYYNKR